MTISVHLVLGFIVLTLLRPCVRVVTRAAFSMKFKHYADVAHSSKYLVTLVIDGSMCVWKLSSFLSSI